DSTARACVAGPLIGRTDRTDEPADSPTGPPMRSVSAGHTVSRRRRRIDALCASVSLWPTRWGSASFGAAGLRDPPSRPHFGAAGLRLVGGSRVRAGRRGRPIVDAVEQQLERAVRLPAPVHLVAEQHNVTLADRRF